jgi:hypothetical protein
VLSMEAQAAAVSGGCHSWAPNGTSVRRSSARRVERHRFDMLVDVEPAATDLDAGQHVTATKLLSTPTNSSDPSGEYTWGFSEGLVDSLNTQGEEIIAREAARVGCAGGRKMLNGVRRSRPRG